MKKEKKYSNLEKRQRFVEKGRRGASHVIFGYAGLILLFVLLQAAVLVLLFGVLQQYLNYTYWLMVLLTWVTVLVVINRSGNPEFKLAWMVPMTLFPVFGICFYIFIEMQLGAKVINHLLKDIVRKMRPMIRQNEECRDHLEQENRQQARFADYMMEQAGYPVYENNQVKYFPSGEEKFEALIEELEQAKEFIFLEYFIVAEGRMWSTVHEILKRKVKEGVDVRFLYDGTCNFTLLPFSYAKTIESEGIRCRVFNPIKPVLSSSQNYRDHRKIVVIDGKTAFTGGVNLADEYINEKERFGHWKDTAIMVKGSAVQSFTWTFLQMWSFCANEEADPKYLQASMNQEHKYPADGYVIPYADSPLDNEYVGENVYNNMFHVATKYVHIMTPYLVLDHEMISALTFAAKRGLDVKIIMPGIPDKKYAYTLAKTYFPELLRAGVRIYYYTPGFVHAKEVICDDERAVVGTINMDYRSLYLHFECAVHLYRSSEIARIEEDFQNTLESCREVTLEDCKKEKLITRVVGSLLRLIAPLL